MKERTRNESSGGAPSGAGIDALIFAISAPPRTRSEIEASFSYSLGESGASRLNSLTSVRLWSTT